MRLDDGGSDEARPYLVDGDVGLPWTVREPGSTSTSTCEIVTSSGTFTVAVTFNH